MCLLLRAIASGLLQASATCAASKQELAVGVTLPVMKENTRQGRFLCLEHNLHNLQGQVQVLMGRAG